MTDWLWALMLVFALVSAFLLGYRLGRIKERPGAWGDGWQHGYDEGLHACCIAEGYITPDANHGTGGADCMLSMRWVSGYDQRT